MHEFRCKAEARIIRTMEGQNNVCDGSIYNHSNLKEGPEPILFKRVITYLVFISLMTSFINESHVCAAENQGKLATRLNYLLSSEPVLQGAIAGISIRSAQNGTILYEHNGDVRLRPASNMKLLTAAAALSVLGADHTFLTEVLSAGPLKKGTLSGNLYIKGKGDPTLLKADYDKMASEIHKLGINKIKGNLIGDDSWFDSVRYSSDLSWSDESAYYGAQISALTVSPDEDYDSGSMVVEVKAGEKKGEKPIVMLSPITNFIKINNQAKTVSADSKNSLTISREHAKNTITIKGNIPLQSRPKKEWIGVWNPTMYALTLFKQSLIQNGIKLSGKTTVGLVPDTARVLTSHRSMPLSELLVPFMKLSNNGHAETLVKEMGKTVKGEGTWENGLEVVYTAAGSLGMNTKTLLLRDGSGISDTDLIPANQLTNLLFTIQKEKWFPVFLHSLPVAGAKEKMIGGTLRNRLKATEIQGRIKAKTGTINTVTSLSGYVETKSGQTLVFSIMLNNLLDEKKGKLVEDKIVTLLAGL